MVDDTLGRDPLSEELDSIWKIPQPAAPRSAPAEPPPPALPETEEWTPIEAVSVGEPGPQGMVRDSEFFNAVSGVSAGESGEGAQNAYLEDTIQMVSLRLENEIFGIDIMKVQEIIRAQEVTRVPRTEPYVRGVVNLRGKVIPVISLRERFSFPPAEESSRDRRIMIMNTPVGTVGFEVDAVTEVFRIPKNSILPPPPTATRLDSEYIVGVGTLNGKLLVVLNLDRLLMRQHTAA